MKGLNAPTGSGQAPDTEVAEDAEKRGRTEVRPYITTNRTTDRRRRSGTQAPD